MKKNENSCIFIYDEGFSDQMNPFRIIRSIDEKVNKIFMPTNFLNKIVNMKTV